MIRQIRIGLARNDQERDKQEQGRGSETHGVETFYAGSEQEEVHRGALARAVDSGSTECRLYEASRRRVWVEDSMRSWSVEESSAKGRGETIVDEQDCDLSYA